MCKKQNWVKSLVNTFSKVGIINISINSYVYKIFLDLL